MAVALAAAAALVIALAHLLPQPEGAGAAQGLTWLAALLAAGAAMATLLLGTVSPASAAEGAFARLARIARWAPSLLGAAAALPLLSLALLPSFGAGAAAARGLQGLAACALVLLSAYLCLHLRASLVRARWWLALAIFPLTGLASAVAAGLGTARELLPSALLLALAAFATAARSGDAPGTLSGARVPLGELAALAALATPTLWDGSAATAGAWLLASLLSGGLQRLAPSSRRPAAAALSLLAAAVLSRGLAGQGGVPAWALGEGLACALVCTAASLLSGAPVAAAGSPRLQSAVD